MSKAGGKATKLASSKGGPEPPILGKKHGSHVSTKVSFADVVSKDPPNRLVPRVIGKSERRPRLLSLFKK